MLWDKVWMFFQELSSSEKWKIERKKIKNIFFFCFEIHKIESIVSLSSIRKCIFSVTDFPIFHFSSYICMHSRERIELEQVSGTTNVETCMIIHRYIFSVRITNEILILLHCDSIRMVWNKQLEKMTLRLKTRILCN